MANIRRDRQALQRTMEAIIAESQRTSAQAVLPGVDHLVRPRSQSAGADLPDRIAELVYAIPVQRRLSDLVLKTEVVEQVGEFIHEFSHAGLLRAHSLEPRHTVLLVGPPGNGKTSLAEAFANELSLPLLSLRYDAIVDSFLGETSNRLRKLIDFAALNPCVLFFDEFDAVGKERSDAQETGEIKRVVSSLLMQMDRLPSHTLIICATNHPELLDRAVWRRFELKLYVDRPGRDQLIGWFSKFEQSLNGHSAGISAEEFANYMEGENMSAVEAFTLDVRRKLVLSKGSLSPADAIRLVMKRGKQRLTAEHRERDNAERLPNSPPATRAAGGEGPRKKTTVSKKNPLR